MSVHFKKPVTRSLFLSKSVVIFVVVILKMTTLFERNEDPVTGFLKWTDFSHVIFIIYFELFPSFWCISFLYRGSPTHVVFTTPDPIIVIFGLFMHKWGIFEFNRPLVCIIICIFSDLFASILAANNANEA